ncbi:uncharacterized protein TNCV_3223721 [Trichonephila clavipes]|nr:uncharacterized protein TNCV_3223721 [Trichonephila clavipes]
MLEKVIENWTSRLDYIRASRGSHMPEITFKIEDKESVQDEESSGRQQTFHTTENIEKFSAAVRCRFQSADEVKSASQGEWNDIAKNGFQQCFDELYKRWLKCAVAQGSYFKGRRVSEQLVTGWCSISVYTYQQKCKRNKRNNFGCSFSEAEKSASNFSMWRYSAADVKACRFVYGNPSPRLGQKLDENLHGNCTCDTALRDKDKTQVGVPLSKLPHQANVGAEPR